MASSFRRRTHCSRGKSDIPFGHFTCVLLARLCSASYFADAAADFVSPSAQAGSRDLPIS